MRRQTVQNQHLRDSFDGLRQGEFWAHRHLMRSRHEPQIQTSRTSVQRYVREPGRTWENGHCDSFKSNLRDELLRGGQISTLYEAHVLIKGSKQHPQFGAPALLPRLQSTGPRNDPAPASALTYAALRPVQMLVDGDRGSSSISDSAIPGQTVTAIDSFSRCLLEFASNYTERLQRQFVTIA